MGKLKSWWKRLKAWQKILVTVGVVFVVLAVIGASAGEEGGGQQTEANPTATTPPASPTTPEAPSPPASPSPSPPESPTPAATPTSAVGDKIMAAVKEFCPTERELQDQGALSVAACTDVTGYEHDGSYLTVKTSLYPKDENKAVAEEIALFTFTAIECGDKFGARYSYMRVLASNGDPLLASFRPPLCS